jgi:hypothetical protein
MNKENAYKGTKVAQAKRKEKGRMKPLKLFEIYSSLTLLLYFHRIKKS